MRINDRKRRTTAGAPRALLSLALAVCLLFSMLPTALGAVSAGRYPSDLTPSNTKVYIKLAAPVVFFTGDTYGVGTTVAPAAGTVCQLVTDDYYTHPTDGREYYSVYYLSKRYNVLRSDVQGSIMSDADVTSYITGTVWTQTPYTTLRKSDGLVGDIRVQAVQYALNLLGYSVAMDGEYGEKTSNEVRKFQRAKGLDTDGSAGPLTQAALFGLASGGTVSGGGSSGGSSGGSTATTGTLKTNVSVNLRKSTSTKSARLAVVPKGVTLTYTNVTTSGGTTWYKVVYNNLDGWLMGSFVNAGGSSGGGSSGGGTAIGTVTITKPSTRVRKTANGSKTGTVLALNSVVDLLAQPTSAGGYSWYKIRTSSGLVGFVRGDCATATMGGGGGSVTPSTDKTFIRLPAATLLFTTEAKPASGGTTVSAGTVLQMVSTVTYSSGGETYCSLYYNNKKHNAVYNDVKNGIMSDSELAAYVLSLWNSSLNASLKRELDLVGDVRVYAMQVALTVLGYYTGSLDGTYGGGTQSAVRNFQRKAKITVDGACGNETWSVLAAQAKAVSDGSASGGGGSGGGGGGGTVVGDFGTVNSVEKATWTAVNDGSVALFKKGATATVMDVGTGKVFTIYRWSGGAHADCVPYTSADTKTMCDIVGFPYNSKHPTSSQLAQIKADGNKSNVTYTWPDFKNAFGGGKDIGSAWDRRPALLNVGGRVFAVSIYGFPHGFNGTDSFAKSKFPNGSYFYAQNNYYGMMCVHFVGSTTHSGNLDSQHQGNIDTAYNYAKKLWPTLVK